MKPQASILDQVNELNNLASVLGFQKVDPSQGDMSVQLEIIRLQNEEAHAKREFEWQMEKDKREWDLKLRAQDNMNAVELAKLKQADDRTKLLGSIPETIGRAVAAGIQQGGGEGGGEGAGGASRPRGSTIEADAGEFGVVECPGCQGEVAFGPTAPSAVCSGCGAKFPVKRREAAAAAEEKEQ